MKLKKILLCFLLLFICSSCGNKKIYITISKLDDITPQITKTPDIVNDDKPIIDNKPKVEKNNYVSYNGNLNIINNNLVNQYSEKIILKGLSSHGIQWFPEFINDKNIKTLKKWGANIFRIAMYTDEGGYLSNPSVKDKVYSMADLVINNDMYVIIDWHILHDNNPIYNLEAAKAFFREVSSKYKDIPNVIYEICNEPNGNTTWDDVYNYATEVIKVIRENSKNSIIIVGTPTWSQDVDKAAEKPLDDKLVMYALHFYSGTHKEDLRNKLKNVINKIPIFVSEFGVTDASGYGGIDLNEARTWLNLLKENNISWINWSLANKDEGASFLLPNSPYEFSEENLSTSGKFIKEMLMS